MADQPESAVVTFNCQTHAVTVNKDKFEVKNGNKLILTLTLNTTGGSCAAKFPPGIKAFDFPHGGPPGYTPHKVSDTEVKLTETNNNPNKDPEDYCFRAVVVLDGMDYKSEDPTISNLGTGGGMSSGGGP